MGGGGAPGDQVERLGHLAVARTPDGVAQEDLVAEVMTIGIELEQALALVERLAGRGQTRRIGIQADADPGQDARQLLHVLLGIAGAHAHGVQLHDFAGVVLIDMAAGVAGVVQVAEHGRVAQGRLEQVAEPAERPGPDRPVLVIAHQDAHVGLLLVHVEMVHPEPGHLLLQLVGRIEVAQQGAGGGLAGGVVHGLLIGLLRRLLLVRVGQLVRRLVLRVQIDDTLGHRGLEGGKGVDLGLGGRRQGCVRGRVHLPVEPAPGTDGGHLGGGRGSRAPGQAVEQGQVVRAEGVLGADRRGPEPQGQDQGGRTHRMTTSTGHCGLKPSQFPAEPSLP